MAIYGTQALAYSVNCAIRGYCSGDDQAYTLDNSDNLAIYGQSFRLKLNPKHTALEIWGGDEDCVNYNYCLGYARMDDAGNITISEDL